MSTYYVVVIFSLATLSSAWTLMPTLVPCSPTEAEPSVLVTRALVVKSGANSNAALVLDLQVSHELDLNPELVLMVDGGVHTACSRTSGSCTYKLCDPVTDIEEELFQAFGSRCPIRPGSYRLVVAAEQTGSSPRADESAGSTSVELNFTNGDKSVGCTSFSFDSNGDSMP
ncbi:uncharacterized protein LOC144137657 [Haemaphysalis longicornis]